MALSDYEVRSLGDLFEQWGYPRGNAGRLLRRYYNCGGEGLDGTVVSPVVAARLVGEVGLRGTSVVARREAADGTVKLLVGLRGGAPSSEEKVPRSLPVYPELGTRNSELSSSVECVLMPSHRPDRAAGCVSSSGACSDTAKWTPKLSSRSRSIPGTIPTVETVTCRHPSAPRSSPAMRRIAATT